MVTSMPALLNADLFEAIDLNKDDETNIVHLLRAIRKNLSTDVNETVFFDEGHSIRAFDEEGAEKLPALSLERYVLPDGHDFHRERRDGRHWLRVRLTGGTLVLGASARFIEDDNVAMALSSTLRKAFAIANGNRRCQEAVRNECLMRSLLNKVINAIPEYIAFKDNDSVYRIANANVDTLYFPDGGTIVGKTIADVYPSPEVDVVRSMDLETLSSQAPLHKNFQAFTKQGWIQLDQIRETVRDSQGNPFGVVTISRDVAGERKTEVLLDKRIRLQEILMRIATEFVNADEDLLDAVFDEALRVVGEFILADRAYLFNYDFDARLMHNTNEWCAPGIKPEIENLRDVPMEDVWADWVDPHLNGRTIYIKDTDLLDREGTLYGILHPQGILSLVTIPLRFKDETLGFVGFDAVAAKREWTDSDLALLQVLGQLFTSLLVRRSRYEELNRVKDIESTANQAKTRFLANTSHEIRTPLVSVFNAIYLIANTSLTREQKSYLDIINTSLDILYTLVNGILDLSKIEAGKVEVDPKSADLEDELYRIARSQSYVAFDKSLDFIFDFDYSMPQAVSVDTVRLHQIIVNLISNAIKYTEHGSIMLKTSVIERQAKTVRVEFAVTDTGCGIAPEQMKRITEKYYQIQNAAGTQPFGTGLGLTIAEELVKFLGGRLEIRSRVGVGTTFFFQLLLPIVQNNPRNFDRLRAKTVVLGGGDTTRRRMTASLLASLGMSVTLTSSPANSTYDLYAYLHSGSSGIESKFVFLDRTFFNTVMADPHRMDVDHLAKGILLPLKRDDVLRLATNPTIEVAPIVQVGTPLGQHKGVRLLAVDDNPMNRHTLAAILNRSGYQTDTARNAKEALDMIANTAYSLLLVDIQMPEMDGYELTRKIRTIIPPEPRLPIIALSANAMKSDYDKAIASGMDGYIAKPVRPEQLLAVLEDFLPGDDNHESQTSGIVIEIPEAIGAFDSNGFDERFKDDPRLAAEMLKAFRDEYHHDIEAIQTAVDAGDKKGIREAAHYFKGSCLYVGAQRLVWLCQVLMNEAGSNTIDYVKSVMLVMRVETEAYQTAIADRTDKEVQSL